VNDDYIANILEVDQKWMDSCCSCHLSPPCGFCLRYAEANLVEPEYCDACGNPSPKEEDLLYECPRCGKHVCILCCGGRDTICVDCEGESGNER